MNLIWPGELEIRKRRDGARIVRGSFPYMRNAILSDGSKGRPVKERFKPGAFEFRIADPLAEIHLLVGHDYGQPLASKKTGTLTFKDTAKALLIEAIITAAIAATPHGATALALIGAGLAVGLSPGFRLPPKQTVPDAETIEDEDPSEGRAIIRTINDCLLYEMSIVTAPAYHEAEVELIGEEVAEVAQTRSMLIQPQYRWRR